MHLIFFDKKKYYLLNAESAAPSLPFFSCLFFSMKGRIKKLSEWVQPRVFHGEQTWTPFYGTSPQFDFLSLFPSQIDHSDVQSTGSPAS